MAEPPRSDGAGTSLEPRLLAFRFDVDTHRCIREGVPNLLDLGREADARFTFFVNMGRAVNRTSTLAGVLGGWRSTRPDAPNPQDRPVSLSARFKLGLKHYLVAATLNPKVGAGSPRVIQRALREGHEVGLHGGANHATWQAGAKKWDRRRLEREVAAGKRQLLRAAGGRRGQIRASEGPGIEGSGFEGSGFQIRGFASPGWQSSRELWPVLAAHGFDYVADARGRHRDIEVTPPPASLCCVPTHLCGEPGGVAYLEHHHAIGGTTADALADFEAALREKRRFLVLYDHPYYAGIRRIELLRSMIEAGRQAGYRTATLSEVASLGPPVDQP